MKTENMTEKNSLLAVATELRGALVANKRADGSRFICVSDTAPAWIRAENKTLLPLSLRVHNVLDDRGPDDWVYSVMDEIANGFTDRLAYAPDVSDDALSEIVDGCCDIYTTNLTAWMAESLNNVSLVELAAMEYGTCGFPLDVEKVIRQGQYYAIDRIARAMLAELQREVEQREQAGD